MPRTERGPSRHESGISTYTGGNIPSDYRTNNYWSPIGFMDPSGRCPAQRKNGDYEQYPSILNRKAQYYGATSSQISFL